MKIEDKVPEYTCGWPDIVASPAESGAVTTKTFNRIQLACWPDRRFFGHYTVLEPCFFFLLDGKLGENCEMTEIKSKFRNILKAEVSLM